jgi:hypothetical protein
MLPGTLVALVRVFAQTIGFCALFVAAGRALLPKLLPEDPEWPRPPSFSYGAGFFVGISLFQILLVLGSRIATSARFGLFCALACLSALAFAGYRAGVGRLRAREHAVVTTAGLGLVALFTVTNATAWLAANAGGPAGPPTIWTPLGSIHSGRYANYSIFIASHDRIPYVAQNMGQSMMGACHLLLGVTSPLAALMAWIPVALAALALLVFGVLREHGLSRTWSAAGTYFVFACNVAFSLVAVFILDNGFPIAVIGYSDAITSLGTFVLIALWLRDALVLERAIPFRGVALPGLFALFWTWSAPQNIVVAAIAGLMIFVQRGGASVRFRRPFDAAWPAALAFGAASLLGATQLGVFLPAALREETGSPTFAVGLGLRVRPYVMYYVQHWTHFRRVGNSRLYDGVYESGREFGLVYQWTRVLKVVQTQVWESVRLYGFLLLGLVLLRWKLRGAAEAGPAGERLRAWLWTATWSFVVGYGVVFFLELDGQKWWLTRFLLPATVTGLMALVLALAPIRGPASLSRVLLFGLVVFLGTVGPVLELSAAFHRSFIELGQVDPLTHRLDLLVHSEGPFQWF